MKISVIVPVHNVPVTLLEKCLDALVKQTLRSDEYEIIIVDDCSTNADTIDHVEKFIEGRDNAFLVRHDKNRGLNGARRSGVAAASGEYLSFVDGDDILTRDALENLRMEAHRAKADLVTAPFFRWHPDHFRYFNLPISGRPFPQDFAKRIKAGMSGVHSYTMCGRLFHRDVLSDDIFDLPDGHLHEDVVTFTRALYRTKKPSALSQPIYYYTQNLTSITGKFSARHAEDIFWALQEWIRLAQQYNILAEVSDGIAAGVDKLMNTCLTRCINEASFDADQKIKVLQDIHAKFNAFPYTLEKSIFEGVNIFTAIKPEDFEQQPQHIINQLTDAYPKNPDLAVGRSNAVAKGMGPSDFANRFKDKIIFICQVDYQLRAAAAFVRELRTRGHVCIVMDNSAFASGGLRQLPEDESNIFWRTEHIKIAKPPYGEDWLSTAKLVVTFNDFNDDFRDALEYRNRLGLPSACAIEGINDFLRTDFKPYRHLPYRRCDHVLLTGDHDVKYFPDRKAYVTGIPIIETLAQKKPAFPASPLAALNVNFTYGVLEDKRRDFISQAQFAFSRSGFDWSITQHPADKGDLTGFPVTELSQYELIDQCTVFVSRFATGILEALASGKPAIYFNPHGEQVDKFTEPMGAFDIATNTEELIAALNSALSDIEAGVDFRERALPFLRHHTAYKLDHRSAVQRFADAAEEMLQQTKSSQQPMLDVFFERLQRTCSYQPDTSANCVFGGFERQHKAQLNDEEMLSRYFGDTGKIMIDVGANFGNSCDVYLGKGWTVHAFEPDPNNRKMLKAGWPSCSRLIVNEDAVSDKSGEIVPFYASKESSGISSLSAFTSGHGKIAEVKTITLRDYYQRSGLRHADFLKVDVEGFDKFVLDGFPWDKDKPQVTLAEYEDAKTKPLGYDAHDLAELMLSQGYTVYVSEWHPIIRYGITHDWKRFVKYTRDLDLSKTWGNLIGFEKDPGLDHLKNLIRQSIKFSVTLKLPSPPKTQPGANETPHREDEKTPFYASFGEKVRQKSPRTFLLLQFLRRALAGMWRRKAMTVPALGLVLVLLLAAYLTDSPLMRISLIFGGVSAFLFFVIFYVALRSYIALRGLMSENADHSSVLAASLDAKLKRIDERLIDTQKHAQHTDNKIEAMRSFTQHLVNQQAMKGENLQRRNEDAITQLKTSLSETQKDLAAIRHEIAAVTKRAKDNQR